VTPLLKLDVGTRVLCWSYDRNKVYRCVAVWHFSHGGELLCYGACRAYYFVLRAEDEGITWLRGGWSKENVAALFALEALRAPGGVMSRPAAFAPTR